VFRVTGVFSERVATMPLARMVDITMDKPFHGRLLGYGHFTFESAAQDQGLKNIRHVGDPDGLDKKIQETVQQGAAGRPGPGR
jgi:PH (Pleckstrin Homology) domain-containing protein